MLYFITSLVENQLSFGENLFNSPLHSATASGIMSIATVLGGYLWSLEALLRSFTLVTITLQISESNSNLCCNVFPENEVYVGAPHELTVRCIFYQEMD